MKTKNNRVSFGFLLSLKEEFAGASGRSGAAPVLRVESLRARVSPSGKKRKLRSKVNQNSNTQCTVARDDPQIENTGELR